MSALSGVRVVSIALNVPGPLAVSRLASEGARVIKIEPPGGDPLSTWCATWYSELHRQVAVERLDLKSTDGRSRILAHLGDADVFVASQRPAALKRLGLDADALPHVRHLDIVGDRREPAVAGHDLTYQARAGLLAQALPRTLIADVMGAERAFATALLLLRQPRGARAEVGLYDTLREMTAPRDHGLTARGGPLGGGLPAYGVYPARDGWIAVAALEPHFRARLYHLLDLPHDSALDEAFMSRGAHDWEAWGREHDLPLAALRD